MADFRLDLAVQQALSNAEKEVNKALETFKLEKLKETSSSGEPPLNEQSRRRPKADQKGLNAFVEVKRSPNSYSRVVHRQSKHRPTSFDERVLIEYRLIVAEPSRKHYSAKQISKLLWFRLVECAKDPEIKNRPSDVIGVIGDRTIQLMTYPKKSISKKNISDRVYRLELKRNAE